MKNIGKELDRIITEKGMVKKKLAEHLGITPAWLILPLPISMQRGGRKQTARFWTTEVRYDMMR